MFVIRPAQPGDAPAILQMIRELADYEKMLDRVQATEADVTAALFGPRPVAEALLGDVGGAPVGFALFFATFSTFVGKPGIFLEDLFVRPEHRHQGIGKAFFRELAKLAVKRGCGRMEWSVLDWNEPALAFYRSLGAAPLADWTMQRL